MKKILFILICILGFVGLVSAKTQIQYDWGTQITDDEYWSTGLIDGFLGIITYDSYSDNFRYVLLLY